jgi:ABC-type dipeptide/oligopeptide/nickel transport system permease component
MGRFLLRRLAQAILVIVAVSAVIFFIMRLVPGDPARLMEPRASEQALAALRVQLGLNKPVPVQFALFVVNALHGDLGSSYYQQAPVLTLIAQRLPLTLFLTAAAMAQAIIIGLPMGFLAATHRGTPIDKAILGVQMLFQSAPNFFVALVLLLVVGVNMQLIPAIGYIGPESVILPSVSLAIGLIAIISRVARGAMMEVLELDWVKALRARGISRRSIIWRHAFKSTFVPTLTLLGGQIGYLLGGAVVVEWIFNYPGLGLLTLDAVLRKDYPLVQAIVIVTASIFVLVNFLIDVSYGIIDPRIRQSA